jgi:hypothetical protein
MIEFEVHRPIKQPSGESELCPACRQPLLRLAAFCSNCGQAHPHPARSWSQDWSGPQLHGCSASRDLLALQAQQSLWLLDLAQGHRVAQIHCSESIVHSQLEDSFCHLWTAQVYQRLSLTPLLNGRQTRAKQQSYLPLPGPGLILPQAGPGGQWAWPAEGQLQRVLPSMQRASPIGLEGECLALTSWQGFWVVADRSGLRWWDHQSGQLQQVERWNSPPRSLCSHPQGVLGLDEAGQVWLSLPTGRHCLLHQPSRPGFSICAGGSYVLLCQGREIAILHLQGARWQSLSLPQACVLPALISQNQALLTSYEGSLYQLQIEPEPVRVLTALRLFDSPEPYTQPVAWNGHQVVWLSAENQLVSRPFPAPLPGPTP